MPNRPPQNLIPILGLSLYVFDQLFLGQIQNTSISDCFNILDNLPPVLNIDPFVTNDTKSGSNFWLIQNLLLNWCLYD